MILEWFDSREAVSVGAALADQFAREAAVGRAITGNGKDASAVNSDRARAEVFRQIDGQIRARRFNFFQRAKFANSFKWRLIESGVEKGVADELTQNVIVRLSVGESRSRPPAGQELPPQDNPRQLHARASRLMAASAYAEAAAAYEEILRQEPRNLRALNNLGAAFFHLGHFSRAEECFRAAIDVDPGDANGYGNLGSVRLSRGDFEEAERLLRRCLKLNPTHVDARVNLGYVFVTTNQLREAKDQFNKVLKAAPRHARAVSGLAFIARIEGRLEVAESLARKALKINPNLVPPFASLSSLRRMSTADHAWLDRAQQLLSSGLQPADEVDLCFAMAKYFDDVEDYRQSFQFAERANERQKSMTGKYDRGGHRRFVDEVIRAFDKERTCSAVPGASASAQPVLVVGMPRSGTSLIEQIISSHPGAKGAGELTFWADAVREHGLSMADRKLEAATVARLTEAYLAKLAARCGTAERIVDKAPVNSDHLGFFHSLFPNGRVIYVQRDPVDSCLSCYFQRFTLSLNYTMDLDDLAHYYTQHHRLMDHWRAVLPPGTLLDVPYEGMVLDQERWTRKILDFLGLEWNDQCMRFHQTQRPVATASFWQVRQPMYSNSVARSKRYEKFIAPLLELRTPPR